MQIHVYITLPYLYIWLWFIQSAVRQCTSLAYRDDSGHLSTDQAVPVAKRGTKIPESNNCIISTRQQSERRVKLNVEDAGTMSVVLTKTPDLLYPTDRRKHKCTYIQAVRHTYIWTHNSHLTKRNAESQFALLLFDRNFKYLWLTRSLTTVGWYGSASWCSTVCTTKHPSTSSTSASLYPVSPLDNIFALPAEVFSPCLVIVSAVMDGPVIWNWLPDSLRNQAISRDSFKRSLKTFLFSAYSCT